MAGRARRNRLTAVAVASVAVAMVGMSFAAVPLYRLFCQVTGFGGTTQVATGARPGTIEGGRSITVSFDSSVDPDFPWRFEPTQRKIVVRPGEQVLVHYRAQNLADGEVTGVATFNVTPYKVGPYFNKVECFCFTEQTLGPGERIDMPVMFFVAPEFVQDSSLDDVTDITLSYTFFPKVRPEPGSREARAPAETSARQAF